MNLLLPVMLALVAGQGEAIRLTLPDRGDLAAVTVTWNDRQVPMARDDAGWFAILGADLDTDPGDYPARLQLNFIDGSRDTLTETVTVQARSFRTTELEVEPKYVELSAENQARAAREREEIAAIYKRITPEAYWSEPFARCRCRA